MFHGYPILFFNPGVKAFLALLLIWSLVWKGLGLWKAAQEKQKGWFVAMLILNTAGILEILYLYVFSKASTSKSQH